MSAPEVAEAADVLAAAARTNTVCPPVRSLSAEGDIAAAYTVQRANVWPGVAAGRRIDGRKTGPASPAGQAQLGFGRPDFGAVFAALTGAPGPMAVVSPTGSTAGSADSAG